MIKLSAVTNYTEFYDKPLPEDPFVFLRRFPTDAILVFLCQANAGLFQIDQSGFEGRLAVFTKVFPGLARSKKEKVIKILQESNQPDISKHRELFTKQTLAWLISLCFRNYKGMDDSDLSTVNEVQDSVFDSVLIANEIYYSSLPNFPVATYEQGWELMLRQQNYIRNIISMMQNGGVKMIFFQKFILDHFDNGEELIGEFKSSLGIDNYFDYSLFYMDILSRTSSAYSKDGKIRWHIEILPEKAALVEAFARRPEDFVNGKGTTSLHGDLIPKPIYFINNKYAVVLDFNFLGFLIDTALPYNFYSHTSLRKHKGLGSFSDFKGMLGKDFYEQYMTVNILSKLFPHAAIFKGEQINELTDLMIIKDSDIFLFEIKSAALNHQVLEEINVPDFKSFLEQNFVQDKKVSGKNRGVFQLVNCIRALQNGEIPALGDTLKKGKKYSIYPVIIYMDSALDIIGVNAFCNETFAPAISEYSLFFRHICPLTMVNLNFFLFHYHYLRENPGAFKQHIKLFQKRVASVNQSFRKSKDAMLFLNAGISFADYANAEIGMEQNSVRLIAEDFQLPGR